MIIETFEVSFALSTCKSRVVKRNFQVHDNKNENKPIKKKKKNTHLPRGKNFEIFNNKFLPSASKPMETLP